MVFNIKKLGFRLASKLYQRIREIRWQEWEKDLKKKFNYCGEFVSLGWGSSISNPQRMVVKDFVHIGSHAWIQARGGLEIGENTIISRYCTLITCNHDYEGDTLPYGKEYINKPIHIGKNVWIGTNVMVIPGITIGDGAIVGMGTVVVKDIPPLAIVGVAQQRILGYRDSAHYTTLESQGLYYKKLDERD